MTAGAPSWPGLLTGLLAGTDLSTEDTSWVMDQIMSGQATGAQVAAFAVALRSKGETAAEIAGLVNGMLAHANRLTIADRAVDVVGTGGDRANTVNISSMAAVVTAAAGATVVKHGNRAASSSCGAADLLEGLGVAITLPPAEVAECVARIGIGFCFAPVFHPSFRHTAGPRREMGVPTVFNFLGPLTNPAGARRQLIGVSDLRFLDFMAAALGELGCEHALVVASDDGLDELSASGPTHVVELRDGALSTSKLTPESVGLRSWPQDAVAAGTPERNAGIARRVLGGERGAERDLTVLNAGAAIYVGGRAATIEEGVRAAEAAIDSGAARETMERFVARTRELAP